MQATFAEHHEGVQRVVDVATSSPATAASVGTSAAVIIAGLPVAIQVLTLLVLSAQLIAWCYKFYKWLKK